MGFDDCDVCPPFGKIRLKGGAPTTFLSSSSDLVRLGFQRVAKAERQVVTVEVLDKKVRAVLYASADSAERRLNGWSPDTGVIRENCAFRERRADWGEEVDTPNGGQDVMAVGATRLRVSVVCLNPSVREGNQGRQGDVPHLLEFLGVHNHAGILADFDVIDDTTRGGGA